MKMDMLGNMGCYVDESNVIAFQIGDKLDAFSDPALADERLMFNHGQQRWLSIQGYNICYRGINNHKCDEIEHDIKNNRLMPTLINKQVSMLYGMGPAIYQRSIVEGKIKKIWVDAPDIMDWFESWKDNGLESDYKEVAKANITNFYTFKDFYNKWRFSQGKAYGTKPLVGLELLENKNCRLATTRKDVATNLINYRDFRLIAVGEWGIAASTYSFYPRFSISDVPTYNFAAVSHHRKKSVGEFYGVNETHQGTRSYITGSNDTARYLNSFYRNSLAAKIHIKIPNAWVESKRQQISRLCDENKKRESKNEMLLTFNGIIIGNEYKESSLIEFMQSELRKVSSYLSGKDNQGKAFSSITYQSGRGDTEEWKFENIDLKYKEYTESLIAYDKRADEVLLSSVGIDSSISSVSKDGIISKSGADVYYNYLIYIMQLTPDEEICAEPFNDAIRINFPQLYKKGYRVGFYRETPQRQEDVAPANRLNQQQS